MRRRRPAAPERLHAEARIRERRNELYRLSKPSMLSLVVEPGQSATPSPAAEMDENAARREALRSIEREACAAGLHHWHEVGVCMRL